MSIRINKVYTRSGDAGETGLVGGGRISKSAPRVAAMGDVDELNSYLGLIKEKLLSYSPQNISEQELSNLIVVIENLQQELFDLGSELATPVEGAYPGMWQVTHQHVKRLEGLCDFYNEGLPELKSFILPGGNELVAFLHLARTVARRAERSIVELADTLLSEINQEEETTVEATVQKSGAIKLDVDEQIDEAVPCFNLEIGKYLNRISDLLFVLARWVLNEEKLNVPLWVKEQERLRHY